MKGGDAAHPKLLWDFLFTVLLVFYINWHDAVAAAVDVVTSR